MKSFYTELKTSTFKKTALKKQQNQNRTLSERS